MEKNLKPFPIYLANPRGFCAGVERAIDIVHRALDLFGAPIYVRHEVVHNKSVVNSLKKKGAIFIQNLKDVPDGAHLIFSAHGVSKKVREEAEQKKLNIYDATCPLVTKVHLQVTKFAKQKKGLILIGHAGHPEVEGTLGQYHPEHNTGEIYLVETQKDAQKLNVHNPANLAYVTQTTLSIDDTESIVNILKTRFPNIDSPKKEDICYATQNRQNAVKSLCEKSDLILVVGSPNSSNSNRLCELAIKLGTPAYLIDCAEEIKLDWLKNKHQVGIASGASAPEKLVKEVIQFLEKHNLKCHDDMTRQDEKVKFPLPTNLKPTK